MLCEVQTNKQMKGTFLKISKFGSAKSINTCDVFTIYTQFPRYKLNFGLNSMIMFFVLQEIHADIYSYYYV